MLAKSLLPEKEPEKAGPTTGGGVSVEVGGGRGDTAVAGDDGGWDGGGGVTIVEGERRLSWVRIQMRVPWSHSHDIDNEVIDPLALEEADILCDVTMVAKGEAAIRENTVELVIKESLTQRGLKANIETS